MKIFKLKYNVLLLGLQNIIQIGLIYPFHLIAVVYFAFQTKIKIKTHLDLIILLYIAMGIISLGIGVSLAFLNGYISDVSLQFLKSFFVFITCIIYFGVSDLKVEEFIKVTMWLFAFLSVAILLTYIYLFATETFSLYQLRGQIHWSTGWPQRWVIFAIIIHFLFYSRYFYLKRKIDLTMVLISLIIIFLSGTRSALISVIIGHIIYSFFTKKDFIRLIIISLITVGVISIYWKEFSDAFRIMSTLNALDGNVESGGSIGYRIKVLWPGLINSLDEFRILFGWGHLGATNIPNLPFKTSESQYIDVIVRNGLVGIILYLSILLTSIFYSYKLYEKDKNLERIWIWKASIVWQIAMLFQGITVETTRFSLYGLYYFLFIGLLSINYYQIRRSTY